MSKKQRPKYKVGDILIHRRVRWVCPIVNVGTPMDTIIYEVEHPNGRRMIYNLNELERIYYTSEAARVLYGNI